MAKKPTEYDNSVVVEQLYNYLTFSQAQEEFSFLDNILAGIILLDYGGNTKPLSTRMLYTLLSSMPVISVSAIVEATGYSESHARKLATALRVASKAFIPLAPPIPAIPYD